MILFYRKQVNIELLNRSMSIKALGGFLFVYRGVQGNGDQVELGEARPSHAPI